MDGEEIRLECTLGGSNKFYEISVEQEADRGDSWAVTARYGRIGQGAIVNNVASGLDRWRAVEQAHLVIQKKTAPSRGMSRYSIVSGSIR